MGHGENDSYWKQTGPGLTHNIDACKDIPVFLVGGWYDSWGRQTTMAYAALSKNKRGPIQMILDHAQLAMLAGPEAEAGATLAQIYSWFTEGFETADLKDAKALLDELNGSA
jgi:hypothetical protein